MTSTGDVGTLGVPGALWCHHCLSTACVHLEWACRFSTSRCLSINDGKLFARLTSARSLRLGLKRTQASKEHVPDSSQASTEEGTLTTLGSPLSREVDFSSFFRRALMGSWPGPAIKDINTNNTDSLTPQTDNLQRELETCNPRAVGGQGHNSGSASELG